jgi:5'-3' exonuclease
MGILKFYPQFKEEFSCCITNCINKKYEAVAFDLNQWLHIYAPKYLFDAHVTALQCFYFVSSWESEIYIIVLDGISPPSKLEEQKRRRCLLIADKLQISVGTLFMENFNREFLKHVLTMAKEKIIYYSNHNVPGEGEHKIINLVKFLNVKTLIISIDADVIVLSILNNLYNVDILRIYPLRKDYIDIEKVLCSLPVTSFSYFINVCFLGNDFLPRIKSNISCLIDINYPFHFKQLAKQHNILNYDSEKCKSYLTYLEWVILYYFKHYKCDITPDCNAPKKINFEELQQFCYDNNDYEPKFRKVTSEELTISFQINYIMPEKACQISQNVIEEKCMKYSNLKHF